MPQVRRQKGSILIIVLWALFILSALAMAISGYTRAQISVAGKLSQRARDYYLARAGLERALIEVKNAAEKDYDSLFDSWSDNDACFKDAVFGDGTYSVIAYSDVLNSKAPIRYGLADEESKINVNKAPVDILKNIFEIAGGVSPDDAQAIAASIINWRSSADKALKEGAGEFYYQTLDHPYKAKNAPIEAPEELLLVKGVSRALFNKVKDHITIYGSGVVNINTAGAIVLRSLGLSEETAGMIVDFRSAKTGNEGASSVNVFEDTAKITALLTEKGSLSTEESGKIGSLISKNLISVRSDNFSGIAIGKMGGNTSQAGSRIAFVFDRKNNAIRYWRE